MGRSDSTHTIPLLVLTLPQMTWRRMETPTLWLVGYRNRGNGRRLKVEFRLCQELEPKHPGTGSNGGAAGVEGARGRGTR
ncbi:hypothetical protein NDU88_001931 [Pleurodeles waltl]|uniref:Uncharacterized protein n=1 Tax=Pleurodeles waltl TaxID=8319 RepID=A0AAV7VY65_PLEWA|nr:hypothetical protein NDU88_001931 [Pleurodeles waltl]